MIMTLYVCRFCLHGDCSRCGSLDCACCGDATELDVIQYAAEKASEPPMRYYVNDW